jgi:hypothetical protein
MRRPWVSFFADEAYTAQQEQPRAPKKPLRSAIGSFDVQAPAWS